MPVEKWTSIYDNYDKAMADYVHTLKHDGRPLLTVFATPERALAQVKKIVQERTVSDQTVIPLPFGSVDLVAEVYDQSRYTTFNFRREFWDELNQCYWSVEKPQPINLTYQVHVWSRTLRDLQDILMQIVQGLRAREKYLRVKHPPPLNYLKTRMTLEESRPVPSFDSKSGDQRVLRKVFVFLVHAWVMKDPQIVTRIESITTPLITSEDLETEDEIVDTIVVP